MSRKERPYAQDYDETLRLAAVGGFLPDPYVVNARGNVRASLDDWAGAREDYSESARLFQGSKARAETDLFPGACEW